MFNVRLPDNPICRSGNWSKIFKQRKCSESKRNWKKTCLGRETENVSSLVNDPLHSTTTVARENDISTTTVKNTRDIRLISIKILYDVNEDAPDTRMQFCELMSLCLTAH